MNYVKLFEQWERDTNSNIGLHEAELDNTFGSKQAGESVIKELKMGGIKKVSDFIKLNGRDQSAFIYKSLVGTMKQYLTAPNEVIKSRLINGGVLFAKDDGGKSIGLFIKPLKKDEMTKQSGDPITSLKLGVGILKPNETMEEVDPTATKTLNELIKYFEKYADVLDNGFLKGTDLARLDKEIGKFTTTENTDMVKHVAEVEVNFGNAQNPKRDIK